MTVPANLQQATAPWGADAVVVCWGPEGGPFNETSAANPLPVNVVQGGSASGGATGSAVPASADYVGLNVGGTLRGWTGANPTGSVYAGQVDIASIGGSTIVTSVAGAPGIGGDTAAGVADAGNPVKVGGVASSAGPSAVTAGQRANVWVGLNGQVVIAGAPGGVADNTNNVCGILGPSGLTNQILEVADFAYNGSGWDKTRNNQDNVTLLASATRTSTTSSADQTNYNGRGVLVYLNVTAASGTGGLTLTIQAKDPVTGTYQTLNSAPTAVTATGFKTYELYPGAATTGGLTQAVQQPLPRTWRVQVAHGDSSNYTYSVSASVLL
jgi:hypothetical protein